MLPHDVVREAARLIRDGGHSQRCHARDALEALAKLNWARWRPISTAPVPPIDVLKDGRWYCLMQDKKGNVKSGYAAYMQARRGNAIHRKHDKKPELHALQWYTESSRTGRGTVFKAVKWMPLPPPEIEP